MFNFEMTTDAAPDNLIVSPVPPENHEADAATNPSPSPTAIGPLVLSAPENQEPDAATNPSLNSPALPFVLSTPENQEPDATAKPAPDLAHLLITDPHNSGRSLTPPRLDMRGTRARPKRRHSRETGDKARLVPQDVLTTRVAIQEKDRTIERLEDEVSD